MLVYFIFVGVLAATDASQNQTVTKDKRQVNREVNRNFVPATHQSQSQYAPSNEQISAVSPTYYNYVQNQHHQTPDPAQENTLQRHQHQRQHIPPTDKRSPLLYYSQQPQVQYESEPDNQPHLHPKPISEEEYLELIQTQNGENAKHSETPKHPTNRGQYKGQQVYTANEQPQSYLKTYLNPLGEFSLEKELAKLEKSNKAIYQQNPEADSQQSLKKENYEFRPSHQLTFQHTSQHDEFIPADYAQFNGISPYTQKLVDAEYEREESVAEKSSDRPEYSQYATPTESSLKYYTEAAKTQPKNPIVQYPKHQYLADADNSPYSNNKPNPVEKVNQRHHQYPHPSPPLHSIPAKQQSVILKSNNKFHEKSPQPQTVHAPQPSRSTIFVSQSTGIQQKPQEAALASAQHLQSQHQYQQQPRQQYQQQLKQNIQPRPQQQYQQHRQQYQEQSQPRPQQLYQPKQHEQQQHEQQQQHQQQQHENEQIPRLPLPNPNRPLSQEEFQALVDAGYKVQAIPIPVPVPVSAQEYAQHQQHLQQPKQQTPQQVAHQVPTQIPQQVPQQAQQIQQTQPHRPQPSTKHFVRYQNNNEGILSSYLRPLFEQYTNLMSGKI